VSVYNSYKTTLPWTSLGGTSASTPMWTGRAAAAQSGYDMVTGLGSWTGATP
jgi:subtilase family serine protease